MPRKSSFLQGFETGTAIYDRAQSRKLQKDQLDLQTRQARVSEDAAEQRKRRLEQEIKEAEFKAQQRAIVAVNRAKAQTAYDEVQEIATSAETSTPEGYEAYLESYRKHIGTISLDAPTYSRLEALHGGIGMLGVAKAKVLADAQKHSRGLAKAQAGGRREDAQSAELETFNEQWGSNYTDHGEMVAWKDKIKTLRKDAHDSGRYSLSHDFEGHNELSKILDIEVAAHENRQTEAEEVFRRQKVIELEVEKKDADRRRIQLSKDAFYKFARETNNLGWKFDNPAHQKEFRNVWDTKQYVMEFAKGGTDGVALMNSIQKHPDGGFDNNQLALALGKLEGIKAEMKKAGQVVNLTEPQSKTLMYGVAMFQAQNTLDALAKKGYHALTVKDRALYVAGTVAGMSSDGQVYVTAMSNWNNAKLRKDSGAAITIAEVENYQKTLFPRLGEKKASRDEKLKVREAAYKAMKWSGGSNMKQFWIDMEKDIGGVSTIIPSGPAPVVPPGAGSARYPGTATTPTPPTTMVPPQPAVGGARPVITGTQKEINAQIQAINASGTLKPGEVVRYRDPATGMTENVPPAPAQPAPGGESFMEVDPREAPWGVDASGDPIVPAGEAPAPVQPAPAPAQPAPAEPTGHIEEELQAREARGPQADDATPMQQPSVGDDTSQRGYDSPEGQPQRVAGPDVEGAMVAEEPSDPQAEPVEAEAVIEELEAAIRKVIPPKAVTEDESVKVKPLRPDVPGLESKPEPKMKLPPLPKSKQMSARERRARLVALKRIVDKVKNKTVTVGDSEITIRGHKPNGVAVVRDGKPMLITWEDFGALMDKLGYLK